MDKSVPKAVPTSVAPSAQNSVNYLTGPQTGPLNASTGSAYVPYVPRAEGSPNPAEITPNPKVGNAPSELGTERESGSSGAPSLPSAENSGGFYPNAPIDSHYTSEFQGGVDPYRKVNNPPTRGMFTFVKAFINGIATSQDVDNAGFKVRHPQQRTSFMRVTPPPHGGGYAPEIYEPKQQPQNVNTYKYNPQVGTQQYGSGVGTSLGGYQPGRVLNSDTYGAGQTAGGIGGNQYTPSPGPPETTSTAGRTSNPSGMPTWG